MKYIGVIQSEFFKLAAKSRGRAKSKGRVEGKSVDVFLKQYGDNEVRNPDFPQKARKERVKVKSLKVAEPNSPKAQLFQRLYKSWKGTGKIKGDKIGELKSKLDRKKERHKIIKKDVEKLRGKKKEKLDELEAFPEAKIKKERKVKKEPVEKTEVKKEEHPIDKVIEKEQKVDKAIADEVKKETQKQNVTGDKTNEQYKMTTDRIKKNEKELKNDISFLPNPPPPSKVSIDEIDKSTDAIQRSFRAANITGANITQVINAPNTAVFKVKFDDDASRVKGTRWLLSSDGKTVISSMVGKEKDVIISEDRKTGTVNVEVPKDNRDPVYLKDILTSKKYVEDAKNSKKIVVPFGRDANGEDITHDFRKNPHLLIAGGTGSGKSVFINSTVNSLMAAYNPDEVKFIMIDVAKRGNELGLYDGSKYMARPVAKDENSAIESLKSVQQESKRRFAKFQEISKKTGMTFKDNFELNDFLRKKDKTPEEQTAYDGLSDDDRQPSPQLFLVADEVKSLLNPEINKSAHEIKGYIDDILAVARQSGVNVLLATQSPALQAVPRQMQANLGSKVVLHLNTHQDAENVDVPDATDLLSKGDAFILTEGQPTTRVQTAFVSGDESTKFSKNSAGEQKILPDAQAKEREVAAGDTDRLRKHIEAQRAKIERILSEAESHEEQIKREKQETEKSRAAEEAANKELQALRTQRLRRQEKEEPESEVSEPEIISPEEKQTETAEPEMSKSEIVSPEEKLTEAAEPKMDDRSTQVKKEIEEMTTPQPISKKELPKEEPKEMKKKKQTLLDRLKQFGEAFVK